MIKTHILNLLIGVGIVLLLGIIIQLPYMFDLFQWIATLLIAYIVGKIIRDEYRSKRANG